VRQRADILGYLVDRVSFPGVLARMEEFIASGTFHQVVVGNIYCVIHARQDREFLEIANSADLTVADGMSLVWASRALGEPIPERSPGPDILEAFTELAAQKGYTFYFVGGGPGGSERVAENLLRRYPDLRILGTHSPELGPIPEEENDLIVEKVSAASPDVLWVGLGSPRQEKWIWRNRDRLNTRVALGVGSAFDYQMGRQQRAPLWMREHGLEWLHRPTQDPSVLWRKRYDRYFPRFVFPVMLEAARRRSARVLGAGGRAS
jgi:N-acetylglucosaminyldiphosphoundecaprenol N-acetyl-beta-D-mannosaminyltransferase